MTKIDQMKNFVLQELESRREGIRFSELQKLIEKKISWNPTRNGRRISCHGLEKDRRYSQTNQRFIYIKEI